MARHAVNYTVIDPKTKEINDIVFRRRAHPHGYVIHWGNLKLGHLLYDEHRGWTAQSFNTPNRPVKGFKTRISALEYILKLDGFHPWMSSEEWGDEHGKWHDPVRDQLDSESRTC